MNFRKFVSFVDLTTIFNPAGAGGVNTTQGQSALYFNGFTIDLHGNIKFPILGEINVLGFYYIQWEDLKEKDQIFVFILFYILWHNIV